MHQLQRYLFVQLLPPLAIACAALAGLALLTQTLSSLSLLVDERETFLLFVRIVLLTLPQLISLILPVALFIAVIQALHRMHADSEIVVLSASGLSRWGTLSPVLRLTVWVMAAHLALGLWLQPYSYREMRQTLHEARVEMAAGLFQPGAITNPAEDLTIFVRATDADGMLRDIMIWDQRSDEAPVVYLAARGRVVESATTPAIVLYDVSVQQVEEDGRLSYVHFTDLPFELGQFIEPPGQLLYKLSDRFAHELLFPNLTHYWELENQNAMLAEGHARLAAPLYDLAVAMIAAFAMLAGHFRRTGYGRRIALAALGALALRVGGFAAQAGAAASPELNALQYALPAAVALTLLSLHVSPGLRRLRIGQKLAAA